MKKRKLGNKCLWSEQDLQFCADAQEKQQMIKNEQMTS